MTALGRLGGTIVLTLGLALGSIPGAMAEDVVSAEVVDGTVGSEGESIEAEAPTAHESAIAPEGGAAVDGRVTVEIQADEPTDEADPTDGTEPTAGPDPAQAPSGSAEGTEQESGLPIDPEPAVDVDLPVESDTSPQPAPLEATAEATAHEEPGGHEPGAHEEEPGGHEEEPGGHEPGAHDDEGHDSDHSEQPARLSCADIDPSWTELELKGHPISGTYTIGDGFRTVQVAVLDASAGGKYVNWSSDGPIDAVILRSGQDAATYEYEPAGLGDTGLLPPLNDRDGRNLSSVLACYDRAEVVVGIDLFLADSDDPVEVGDVFEYVLAVDTTGPLAEAEIVVTLAPEVDLVDAGTCELAGGVLTCRPPLETIGDWSVAITVEAVTAGDAITRASLTAAAGGEAVALSAVEVTRVIGPPGNGGCDGHDDGHDDGHEPGHEPGGSDHGDGCPGFAKALVAACAAFDPAAAIVVLPGPFASRQYLVEGPDGVRIWVEVDEGTGRQAASWEANVPIDLVLTRTGQDVAEFAYDPAVMIGSDIVGPPGGSGKPRPMADMAFCWVERPPVDVGVAADGPVALLVGDTSLVDVTISNRGYAAADPVAVRVRTTAHLDSTKCSGPLGCQLVLGPGEVVSLSVPVTGAAKGAAEVEVELVAPTEPSSMADDNSAVVRIVVDAPVRPEDTAVAAPDVVDVEVSPVVVDEAVLPETGVDSLWLLLAGIGFVAVGTGLVRVGWRE